MLPTAINILEISAPGHEFSVSEKDFTLSETDNQVIYHEESNLFIKLIVPAKEQKFKMELQALNLAKNSLAGIVPEVVAYGFIGEYHYIVSKGCHLHMDDYNLSMFTLEREQRPLINFDYLTQWTASILSILHQTRGEVADAKEFPNSMEYLCKNAQQKHRKFKYFPEPLVEGIPEFLMKFKVGNRDLVSGILHGDFTMGNILGHVSPAANEYESEFRSSNLIDFGDSFIGSIDPLFDIATAFVDLFRCDCNLLAKFLIEYGKPFKYLSYEEFKHRILRYVILYPSECISREFCKILFIMKGSWTESMDWLWVESQLFPTVDFRPSL